jgi:alkaline phosphatase D
MNRTRREFLEHCTVLGGYVLATASPVAIAEVSEARTGDGRFRFSEGVASADPQPDAVLLWTRVTRRGEGTADVALRLQVARDLAFREVVVETGITASASLDFTVRAFVDGLDPDRDYAYRFLAPDGTPSRTGRTRTAPAADASKPLTVAVFSCQHYSDGFFNAYRRLLLDDAKAPPGRSVDLVLHLGDFIYEYPGSDLYDADRNIVTVRHRDGTPRIVPPVPSGGIGEGRSAVTLEDYRHLYRTYLSDPDLQAARARFPFIHVWDDHEVVNDYWQSFVLNQPIERRKVDANQAWFEYIPAALTHARPGPGGFSPARDFKRAEVADAPAGDFDDHYLSREANNLAAIRSLTLYRSLGWGKLADLFLLDERSYRGPRGVDASLLEGSLAPYPLAPVRPETVAILNAGRTARGGRPPATVVHQGREIPNARRAAPVGSMLGAEQKAWFKASLEASGATWKIVCNSVPMMRFGFDVSFRPGEPDDGLLWTDSWDGYPVERNELMAFIAKTGLGSVVSLSGDRHAQIAGLVCDDYDAPAPRAIIPEFACASTSASCRTIVHGLEVQHEEDLRPLFLSIRKAPDGTAQFIPTLNAWLLFGAEAARVLHRTGDAAAARRAAKTHINPHLRYADMDAYGYLLAHFAPERMTVEFVTIPEPATDPGEAGPAVRRRVRYTVRRWDGAGAPVLPDPEIEDEPPLLGLKRS